MLVFTIQKAQCTLMVECVSSLAFKADWNGVIVVVVVVVVIVVVAIVMVLCTIHKAEWSESAV